MTDPTDRLYLQMLVVRCQTGDRVALEELVGRCQPRLRVFLHKLLGRADQVDDLSQEIWADVVRDLPRLNDPGAFLPWFYRIARNRAYRLFRGRREAADSLDLVEPNLAAAEEPEFSAEDARAVHAALDQLGPEHREALMLRFMEEMSYEQIAAVAGCQVGTVRSRIHNAKRQLREIIERQNK
jgi:RNA polymerase sigma-70 factor, ECF subfamily